jgi:hypothetical protein
MTNRRNHGLKSLPIANYSPAIARALEWLGDRYLLAKPINAVRSSATPAMLQPDGEFCANPAMTVSRSSESIAC